MVALCLACLQVLLISPANGENEQYSSRYENSYNGDSGKERLQIEGTELRGVEEGTGSSNRYNRANGVIGDNNNFNNYWARLNWGRPSSSRASSSWTEESRKRIQWRPTTTQVNQHQPSPSYASPKTTSTIQKRSRNAPHSEGEEMAAAAVQTAAASSAVVAYDPEVELIDSSKISADLANLRYMRMEEVKEKEKEKDKETAGYY